MNSLGEIITILLFMIVSFAAGWYIWGKDS